MPTALHAVFAARLREERDRRGFSQAALAEAVGVSSGYIGDLELGKKFPSPALLERFARAFDTQPYRLLTPPDEGEAAPEARDIVYGIGNKLKKVIDDELKEMLAKYTTASMSEDKPGES